MVHKKISTGINGLDDLIDGGIRANTVSMVVGSTGTGKTLFSLQYILTGLINNTPCLYISLEESKDKLIMEAASLGWNEFPKYIENGLLKIIKIPGKDFKKFIETGFMEIESQIHQKPLRIAVDPINPLLWSIPDKPIQRDFLSRFFNMLSQMGTGIVTLETPPGYLKNDVLTPVFLSDYVFYLTVEKVGKEYARLIRVIKARGSGHYQDTSPVQIYEGCGLVVQPQELKIEKLNYRIFDAVINSLKKSKGRNWETYVKMLELTKKKWDGRIPSVDLIKAFLTTHRIKLKDGSRIIK
jgi:circadian clock protein KaiC